NSSAEDSLAQAAESTASGEFAAAADIYRKLLEGDAGGVVRVGADVYRGVAPVAEERLGALPEAGLLAYRRTVDARAAHLLDVALASADRSELAKVAFRYLLTSSGEKACVHLGDLALESGELERAIGFYRRALRRYDEATEAPAEILSRIIQAERAGSSSPASEAIGPVLLGKTRWVTKGPRGVDQHVQTSYDRRFRRGSRWSPPPGRRTYFYPSLPVIDGDKVYIAGPTSLKSVSLKSGEDRLQRFRPVEREYQETSPQAAYSVALDRGRLFGTFIVKVRPGEDFSGLGRTFHIEIKTPIPIRKLMGFDAMSGKKLWDIRESKEPFLRKASFPAPPIAEDGVVYATAVLMEGYIQSYLCALGGRDGQLRWKTLIGSGQVEATMFVYHAREALGTPAAEAAGVLYVSNNMGLVAAVRADDGAILWVSMYESIPIEAARNYRTVYRNLGWANNPPIVVDGVVVVAPLDSDYLYGFDRATGKILWRHRRERSPRRGAWDLRFILGGQDGNVFVSGTQAAAIRVSDGHVQWIGPDVTNDLYRMKSSGRGQLVGDVLVIPASQAGAGFLFFLDVKTGKQTGRGTTRIKKRTQMGNLIVHGDTILLAVRGMVKAFSNRAAVTGVRTP
ncbi:MAG: PQQ-binding-like beta-propeller repeat protein, partial [Planctomycetota bacterium]|nr:PQQ-binding-like beta-propeller repeat protein [Planctomycetota bacterium]